MKNRVWGYARISTPKQKIERQLDNISKQYPDAVIIQEAWTGTSIDRPAWNRLVKQLKPGDTIIFDEVSRMSRNAAEGVDTYQRLFEAGINLIFLKEPHINTSVYRDKMNQQLARHTATGNLATDKLIDSIMAALHQYTIDLAQEQIALAFQSAQREVEYIRKRTSEGVRKAQAKGKQVGRATGSKIETKKSKAAKEKIMQHSKDFGGSLNDTDCIKLVGLSRNTYYKYKRELREG